MLYLDIERNKYFYYKENGDRGTGMPNLDGEYVFTQSEEVRELCEGAGVSVQSLSSYLGLMDNIGLYEIYSYYFDGKISDSFDMLEIIFNAFLLDTGYCFCLKIGVTFCWFKISSNKIIKLGRLQFSDTPNKYTVGKFIKKLRNEIARSGMMLKNVRYMCWDDSDMGSDFLCYIPEYTCLSDFFGKIQGLKGLDSAGVFRLLSKEFHNSISMSASLMVDGFMDSFNSLGLYEKDGVLYSRNTYYKDYSICVSSVIDYNLCTYGIVLDCEGKDLLTDGCRELGGLIYCKYGSLLLSVDMFHCGEELIEETLLQVCENFKAIAGYNRSICVLTFGSSDEVMLTSSINSKCSKTVRKTLLNRFRFVDCRRYIKKYTDSEEKLEIIAKKLDVLPVYPKHNPVNDARTLFNILAKILQENKKFVV